jgi:hypothetical protein
VVRARTRAVVVTLRTPAPAGGRVVQIFATNSLAVPAAVRVLEGESTATFTVTTNPVNIDVHATVTAYIRALGLSSPLAISANSQR